MFFALLSLAALARAAYSDAAAQTNPYGPIKQFDTGTYGPELKLEHLFYDQVCLSIPLSLRRPASDHTYSGQQG